MQRYDIEETLMEKRDEGEFVKFADHQAALDAVLKEAIIFARAIYIHMDNPALVTQAEQFLDSPAVQDYRARQEQG